MKIVITALGSGGDVFPFITFGQVLQQRGHTVALLANPHFAETVAQAGLSLVPLGTEDEYLTALRQPEIWHPRRGFAVIWRQLMELTPRILATLEAQIVPNQTVLVGSTAGRKRRRPTSPMAACSIKCSAKAGRSISPRWRIPTPCRPLH